MRMMKTMQISPQNRKSKIRLKTARIVKMAIPRRATLKTKSLISKILHQRTMTPLVTIPISDAAEPNSKLG